MSPDVRGQRAVGSGQRRLARFGLLGALVLPATACLDWFTDFKRTPMVATWEQDSLLKVRGAPQGSVPTTGTAVAAFQVSYMATPAALDSVAALVSNPTPATEESLARGRMYFQHNCAVCHGNEGKGDGTATTYGMIPMPIVTDITKARSDGYLFAIMRNGRGAMPPYNRIEEPERWDVVNYVRALQGVVTGVKFETGPIAMPGVNGDKVPGATRLGPNHWVRPARVGADAAPTSSADSTAAAPQGGR